jgi:hypothetical protein
MKVTKLTRRTHDFSRGLYAADSTSDAYGSLQALRAVGKARLVGEHYPRNGVRSIIVRVGEAEKRVHRNPDAEGFEAGAIGIGAAMYTKSLEEYDPWGQMWFREAIQNAMDAPGCTAIDITVKDNPDGTATISVEDNGSGMDLETLQKRFLMLGESGKRGDQGSNTGGFGKAKELLLLPWLSWEVHTRNLLARGKNITYGFKTTTERQGTRLTVVMPSDRKATDVDAKSLLTKSYIPHIRFHINGEYFSARRCVNGTNEIEIRGLPETKAQLFHTPRSRTYNGFFVRKNGLFMWEQSLPSDVPGYFVLEVTAPSIEVFNSIRMGFRDWTLRSSIENYLASLAKDVMTATKKKRNEMHRKWAGAGKFKARAEGELQAVMNDMVGAAEKITERSNIKKIAEVVQQVQERRKEEEAEKRREQGIEEEEDDEEGPAVYTTTPGAVETLLDMNFTGPEHVEAAIKQLSWEPDFYIHNTIEAFHVPKRFEPERMQAQLKKLARFWAELCRAILIRLGSRAEYGVGWIFEQGYHEGEWQAVEGEWIRDPEGDQHLLLNPFRGGYVGKVVEGSYPERIEIDGDMYSLRKEEDLKVLYALALHECTHLHNRTGGHNEAFSSALTSNIAIGKLNMTQIRSIRDEVVKRPAGWKAKPKAAKSAGPAFDKDIEMKFRALIRKIRADAEGFYSEFWMPYHDEWGFFVKRRDIQMDPSQFNFEASITYNGATPVWKESGFKSRKQAAERIAEVARAEVAKAAPAYASNEASGRDSAVQQAELWARDRRDNLLSEVVYKKHTFNLGIVRIPDKLRTDNNEYSWFIQHFKDRKYFGKHDGTAADEDDAYEAVVRNFKLILRSTK